MSCPIDQKGFGIVHLNTCSYLRRYDEICSEFMKYDIIALTETWLSPKIDDRLARINDFVMIRQDRNRYCPNLKPKKGGGILVHIKAYLGPYITILHDYCMNDMNTESLWLCIHKPGRKKSIICILYRPPNGSVALFINYLDTVLNNLIGKGIQMGRTFLL